MAPEGREVFQPRHDLLQRPPVPLAHRLEFVRVAAAMVDQTPQDRPAVRQDLLVYLLSQVWLFSQ
jgi:hypothetical protein